MGGIIFQTKFTLVKRLMVLIVILTMNVYYI